MKVHVEISVFTSSRSVGRVYGALEFAAVPQIGSRIVLTWPSKELALRKPKFNSQILVEDVYYTPNLQDENGVSIILEDITCESVLDAKKVAEFLCVGFGLMFDDYGVECR
jgi:hypothetical protein